MKNQVVRLKNQVYQKKIWQSNWKTKFIGEKTGFLADKPCFSRTMTIEFEKPGFRLKNQVYQNKKWQSSVSALSGIEILCYCHYNIFQITLIYNKRQGRSLCFLFKLVSINGEIACIYSTIKFVLNEFKELKNQREFKFNVFLLNLNTFLCNWNRPIGIATLTLLLQWSWYTTTYPVKGIVYSKWNQNCTIKIHQH